MKSCLRRLGRLGQVARWPVALALVVFLLFHLSSFLKEPSTQPSRYQYRQDVKERAPELPPKATLQAKAVLEGGALATHHPAGDSVRTEPTRAPPEQRHREPSPAATASAKSQEEDRNEADTAPLRGQAAARASNQAKAPTTKTAPSTKTTKGSGRPTRRPTASKSAVAKPQGRAGTTAKRLVPPSQGKPKTTAATTPPAAAAAKTRKSRATTAAVAPAEKKVPVTPAPAQPPSTRGTPRLKAANFKSEPRWDFEEQYSMDAAGLKTSCPDSIKVKAARSPWLRSLFLPNLTLFLDSRHFNQSEWDRLEHFGPPFGFMELNHSLVQKVVAHFPPVPQQQLLLASNPPGSSQCITCAVVGNGGILNNSRVGQEIDSHDYVFRLSGAVIKGYEQDVGTRTSFYGFTAFSVTQSLLILGSRGFQSVPVGKDIRYLHFLEGTRDFEWLEALLQNQTLAKKNLFWFRRRPQEAFKEALQLDKYLLLHPDFLRYMKNRFLRSKTLDTAHWRIYRPTTGALLLLTALHLCDKVSAYGFITEGHERFSDHYYDKTWKKLIFYINHDFKLERDVWKRLHDEGLIRLFQRPDAARAKS